MAPAGTARNAGGRKVWQPFCDPKQLQISKVKKGRSASQMLVPGKNFEFPKRSGGRIFWPRLVVREYAKQGLAGVHLKHFRVIFSRKKGPFKSAGNKQKTEKMYPPTDRF